MSLRRTALARRTELRRTETPRRTKAVADRARKTLGRQRDTGPTPATRRLVAERAGYCCELCGARLHDGDAWTAPHSFHHRQPRGAGGTTRPEANAAPNLLLLCGSATTPDGCHQFVENHRKAAEHEGWLVRRPTDPAEVPVSLYCQDQPVLLTVAGDYAHAQEEA